MTYDTTNNKDDIAVSKTANRETGTKAGDTNLSTEKKEACNLENASERMDGTDESQFESSSSCSEEVQNLTGYESTENSCSIAILNPDDSSAEQSSSYLESDQETKITCEIIESEKKKTNKTKQNPCNSVLDDEIRTKLDRLNALSDMINSLERESDEANNLFKCTLKCSTDRLSSIAKTLGNKSIRHGRDYHAAKFSVEQSQLDCQKACVQFEQANNDHQLAKQAIKEAEFKLRLAANECSTAIVPMSKLNVELDKLKLNNCLDPIIVTDPKSVCDTDNKDQPASKSDVSLSRSSNSTSSNDLPELASGIKFAPSSSRDHITSDQDLNTDENKNDPMEPTKNAAKLSEELNTAIKRLVEAEQKRGQSEKNHLEQANRLMFAQENLLKMERDHGPSIRRSQLYFEEAKQFNAKLNSVKNDIYRISEELMAAKQSYAATLRDLELFSEELHEASNQSFCESKQD